MRILIPLDSVKMINSNFPFSRNFEVFIVFQEFSINNHEESITQSKFDKDLNGRKKNIAIKINVLNLVINVSKK